MDSYNIKNTRTISAVQPFHKAIAKLADSYGVEIVRDQVHTCANELVIKHTFFGIQVDFGSFDDTNAELDAFRLLMGRPIPKDLLVVASRYDVNVIRDPTRYKGYGGAINSTILLGNFDSAYRKEILTFFHELGHILINRNYFNYFNPIMKLTEEALAWEVGIAEARKLGYLHEQELSGADAAYINKCYTTYLISHSKINKEFIESVYMEASVDDGFHLNA